MGKRYFIITTIVVIMLILTTYSVTMTFKNVAWTYAISKNHKIVYISQSDKWLMVTTKDVKENRFKIKIFNKATSRLINTFNFNNIDKAPELFSDHVIVTTSYDAEKKQEGNYIYVIDPKLKNLIWKDRYYSTNWEYILDDESVFYVDQQGALKNVRYYNKIPKWKLLIKDGFKTSTRPIVQGENLFLCNNNTILAIDKESSKVKYHFSSPAKAKCCSFNDDVTALIAYTDELYMIDLSLSKIIWSYKYVSLFSESVIDIIRKDYVALLNTIDLSGIVKSDRAKIVKTEDQILQFIRLYTGQTVWQKALKHPITISRFKEDIYNDLIVIQTSGGALTGYELSTGETLWQFYNKEETTPSLVYNIKDNRVFVFVSSKNNTMLYILNIANGNILDKIVIPNCVKDELGAVIDDKRLYLSCQNNILGAINIPKHKIVEEKEY
jgi:outer membrane protein assembly factor BamB